MDKLIWTMLCNAASAIKSSLSQPVTFNVSDYYDWRDYANSQRLQTRVAYVKLSPAEREVYRYCNGDK